MVNRRVAMSMLSRYGAKVAGKELDLVLMDIQMPEVT
jgi:hypothetical protein